MDTSSEVDGLSGRRRSRCKVTRRKVDGRLRNGDFLEIGRSQRDIEKNIK